MTKISAEVVSIGPTKMPYALGGCIPRKDGLRGIRWRWMLSEVLGYVVLEVPTMTTFGNVLTFGSTNRDATAAISTPWACPYNGLQNKAVFG